MEGALGEEVVWLMDATAFIYVFHYVPYEK